ncbi:CRP/FNR family transcriptional regulator [Methylorubrum rhodinum]|uniref:CRP/FNR family transcriptional regulator n=2 Tax=Methylorubrum TaxID=2282523 RepID=A0A840ZN87_9HYPH|nr:Crp/Fnr family transcriptional regulator [Methylorubrum rhodinum]MBB5758644.1 CRP/FNR family transcriptional regulator [Methylorubrum rhodinum]
MSHTECVERWFEQFPVLGKLPVDHLHILRAGVHFPVLEAGATAYELAGECANYLMCIEGRTRVFRMSAGGRQILIYRVGPRGTCVLTTQCLLSGGTFPAESVAEQRTVLAALPAETFRHLMAASPAFRTFVLDDYAKLTAILFGLLDEIAFAPLEQRLAGHLLAQADGRGMVTATHWQIAADLGTVREVVSRHLAGWERAGWVRILRGQVEIRDRIALASLRTRP